MYASRLREALPRVQEAIARAAAKAGRGAEEVTLVVVTKSHPLEALRAVLEAGIRDVGENRLEELGEKSAAMGRGSATWHMVGHLQSRKARDAVELVDLLHSVDSLKLARRLSEFAREANRALPVLVQVNTSGEGSKSGFSPEEAVEAVHGILEMGGVEVRGLMTMAPFVEEERVLRGAFAGLRRVHEDLGRLSGYRGRDLSMGMTNDFELAVEEGSTMVRIGTALLGERPR